MKHLWNWGIGIATAYTIFAGATLGFVVFAMRQPVDLVSADYYGEAQAHDQRQRAEERALSLGDAFRIDADAAARTLVVTWPIHARPDSGRIHLYRPSDSRADRTVDAVAGPGGVQLVSLADLAAGNWTVRCEWRTGPHLYYAERPIVMR